MSQKSFFILAPFISANSLKWQDLVCGVLWETHSNSALGGNCFWESPSESPHSGLGPLYKGHTS